MGWLRRLQTGTMANQPISDTSAAGQDNPQELGPGKQTRFGVILEQHLEVGGGFQQSLNDLLWFREWASSTATEFAVFTPHPQNAALLEELGIKAELLKIGILDRLVLFLKLLGPFDAFQRILRIRAPIEMKLMSKGVDIVYFTTTSTWHFLLYKLPFIMTILDGCHRDAPEFDEVREFGAFETREMLFRSACTKAVLVLANNAELVEDLVRRYAMEPARAVCIPFSPSTYVSQPLANDTATDSAVFEKYLLQPGYLFYPAQFWSHKNHATLIDAAALLRDEGITRRIVLCGSDRGVRQRVDDLVARYDLRDQVSIIGFVDSRDLGPLYRGASALVMPSYFGPSNLPPLEAWTVGTPVIYPEAFKSFVGDAALLFDYDSARALADAIRQIDSEDVRASLRQNGYARLKYFSEQLDAGHRQFAEHMVRLKLRRRVV